MVRSLSPREGFQLSIFLLSLVNVFLYIYSAIVSRSLFANYLIVNLLLAWVPLLVTLRLLQVLKNKPWSSWEGIGLSMLWLLFLPNSFYMISDYIHLPSSPSSNILYDAVAFTSIIFSAMIVGLVSLYLIHRELRKRLDAMDTNVLIGLTIALCSLAIYIGRDLRWNSWDVITNPGGLIYDLDIHLIHLNSYPQLVAISGLFFLLIGSLYLLTWNGIKFLRTYP